MKVLMINGSPRANGNTSIALNEMKTVFEKEGVDAEIVQVGSEAVRGCIACNRCAELGKCVFDDAVSETVWDKEEIIYADLDMQKVPASRMEHDVCGHYARPDVLKLSVEDK